jgi:hypothetical protein
MDIANIEKTIKSLESKKNLTEVEKSFLDGLKSKLTNKTILK